jgi:hypothetical protein
MNVEHPVFTAQGSQDWVYGPDGEKLFFPVDRYFDQGARSAVFLGETVTKYHRRSPPISARCAQPDLN